MQRHGTTVLLCGVRPELAEAMARLHFQEWLPEGCVFLEEEVLYYLARGFTQTPCGYGRTAHPNSAAPADCMVQVTFALNSMLSVVLSTLYKWTILTC